MGLDVSHDAFSGAYSAFNRFRQIVAWAQGGSFPPHYKRNGDGSLELDERGDLIHRGDLDPQLIYFGGDVAEDSGYYEFIGHSDCDGEISPGMCAKVADDLEALLPRVAMCQDKAGGHIQRDGGYAAVLRRFIAGCRAAHAAGEPLSFH